MLVKLIIVFSFLNVAFGGGPLARPFNETDLVTKPRSVAGLHKACILISKPINSHRQTSDIVLNSITDQLHEAAYKLQVLRMRLGHAWEWVFTDYGFTKQPRGIDLINHRRKIAIELKNGYRINSIVRRVDLQRLQEFKTQHPRYTVILGFINDKTVEGKSRMKNGIHVMSGRRFLQHVFMGEHDKIIRSLRRAVRAVCC